MKKFFKSILAFSLLTPTALFASGLDFPDNGTIATQRGGASVLGIHDATAGFLNPGLLSRLNGFQLTYNHNLMWANSSFDRQASSIPQVGGNGDQTGMGSSSNQNTFFPFNGLIALSYKPKASPLTFGFSVYGPNASGASSFNPQGSQRYLFTGQDALLGYAGASIAYGTDRFGVGLTLQYATMPYLEYRMVVDGLPDSQLNPYQSSWDVQAKVSLSDRFSYSAIAGAWFEILPNLEIGLSGRVIPIKFNANGTVEVANTKNNSQFAPEQLKIDHPKASLEMVLPRTAKLGIRYKQKDEQTKKQKYDVEMALVFEQWSTFKDFNLQLSGQINLLPGQMLIPVTIPKRWRDTLSLRVGGSYQINDRILLSAGGFYESGASPKQYAHLDFPSFDRFGGALGFSYQVLPQLDVMLGYMYVLPSSSSVDEKYAKVFQQRPLSPCPDGCNGYSGVPANAGTISTSTQVVTLGVNMRFGQ
jgi:long-chain fatty acid transport protein